jgi:hypothetical protein
VNPYTGHLIESLTDERRRDGYLPVPASLSRAARRELAGRGDAHIDLSKPSPLATWAKKKRKAKIAQASRRRNRR